MKTRLMMLAVLGLFWVVLPAFAQQAQDTTPVTTDQGAQGTTETMDQGTTGTMDQGMMDQGTMGMMDMKMDPAMRSYTFDQRTQFEQKLQDQIQKIDSNISQLQSGTQTDDTKKMISRNQDAKKKLEAQLRSVRNANRNNWNRARDNAVKEWESISVDMSRQSGY